MTQYDAGPGDWSDREWEDPEHKQKPQAKRRLALPPWALVAALVTVVILLCVGLIFGVRALTQKGKAANKLPTAVATSALEAEVTEPPVSPVETTSGFVVTSTLEPQSGFPVTITNPITTSAPTAFTQIAPGATVIVKVANPPRLNIRAEPTTGSSNVLFSVTNGAQLVVVAGPRTADGYTWWQVRTADQKVGWAVADYLVLKP